jgi:hypothetical protein
MSHEKGSRRVAEYRHGLDRLIATGMISQESPFTFTVTRDGYLVADELRAAGPVALRE